VYVDINPMDPLQATGAFLDRLANVPDWESRPVGEVAATIQHPAPRYEGRYEPRVPAAEGVVQALWGDADAVVPCGPGAVLAGSYTLPVSKAIYDAHPNWFAQPHHDYPALDVPVPAGTPVYAVAGGRVVASPVGGRVATGVEIAGDDGVDYMYCHGSAALAPPGGQVSVGDLIMISGFSGAVDPPGPAGAHLHLQMPLGPNGPLLCPQQAVREWSLGNPVSSVELPTSGCSY
jgi:murein DD-endopeptidase MepM/ murein hydrolase activator NlpD